MFNNIENQITESTEYKRFRSLLSVIFDWFYTKFCFGILSRFERKFVKFLFVGFINTVFSYIIYAAIVTILGSPTISLLISYIIGILFNFQTTGRIVFKNKDNSLLFKFISCYLLTFVINGSFLKFLTGSMGVDKYLSQAILVFPVAMLSFLLLKNFVFKEEK